MYANKVMLYFALICVFHHPGKKQKVARFSAQDTSVATVTVYSGAAWSDGAVAFAFFPKGVAGIRSPQAALQNVSVCYCSSSPEVRRFPPYIPCSAPQPPATFQPNPPCGFWVIPLTGGWKRQHKLGCAGKGGRHWLMSACSRCSEEDQARRNQAFPQ